MDAIRCGEDLPAFALKRPLEKLAGIAVIFYNQDFRLTGCRQVDASKGLQQLITVQWLAQKVERT